MQDWWNLKKRHLLLRPQSGRVAAVRTLGVRGVTPPHEDGDHVEQVVPRLLHLDAPEARFEHHRTDGVTHDGAEHVQVLFRYSLLQNMINTCTKISTRKNLA